MSAYLDDCLADVGDVVWCKVGSTFCKAGEYYRVTNKRVGLFAVADRAGTLHLNPSARFYRVFDAAGFPVTSLEDCYVSETSAGDQPVR